VTSGSVASGRLPALLLGLCSLLAGVVLFAVPTPAAGHASLVRAQPSANVILDTPPMDLRLWYDEEVAPGLSVVSILDRANLVVTQGGRVDAKDGKLLELPVERLRPGIYTVSWKVLSAVDGHITRGAFAFTFLPPGTDPARLLEFGPRGVAGHGWGQSLFVAFQILATWAQLAFLFVGVGILHFPLVVLAPSRRSNDEQVAIRDRLLAPAAALATNAFTGALIAGIVWWEATTHLTADTSLAHFLFRPNLLPYLLGARTSQSVVLRLGMLVIALIFLHLAKRTAPPSRLLLGYCEAVGAVALFAIALSSHTAAAWSSPLAVLCDTLHLWAGALWTGGLVALAMLLPGTPVEKDSPGSPPLVSLSMRRFTPWAAGSVAVLILSGTLQAFLHVPEPTDLLRTPYGRTLSLKLLLVLPMLFLGGVNSLAGRSSADRASRWPGAVRHWLVGVATWIRAQGVKRLGSPQWPVRGETALGLGVLLCVAVLTQLPPPRAAASARPVTTLRADAGGLGADLTIASPKGLLAPSDLSVRIQQADGRPSEGITRVTLQPSMPGMEMNLAPIVGTPAERGEYRARTLFSMLGAWDIAVKVRRKGVEEDVLFRFPFVVLDVSTAQTELGPSLPERLSLRAAWSTASTLGQLVRGTVFVLLGLAGCLFARRWHWGSFYLIALPFLLAGGYQMVNAMVVDATPTAWHTNPIPADSRSLASGRALYMANCSTCHGETGRGEGLAAARRLPPPLRGADLTGDHMEAHSDGDLVWWISKGIPGTAMPSFEDSLQPEERWHVVNFIRSLRGRASASPEVSR